MVQTNSDGCTHIHRTKIVTTMSRLPTRELNKNDSNSTPMISTGQGQPLQKFTYQLSVNIFIGLLFCNYFSQFQLNFSYAASRQRGKIELTTDANFDYTDSIAIMETSITILSLLWHTIAILSDSLINGS